jgi:SWI/SNF-related matrix-associated actin-dependent regulator of chromatin subfamily A3
MDGKRVGAGKKSVMDILNDRLRRREEGERCDKRHGCNDRKDRGFSSDENDEDWERPSTEQPDSWGGSRGTTFSLELAKSGRARCKQCFQCIEKHSLRVGMSTPSIQGHFQTTWFHPHCFPRKVTEHQLRNEYYGSDALKRMFMQAIDQQDEAIDDVEKQKQRYEELAQSSMAASSSTKVDLTVDWIDKIKRFVEENMPKKIKGLEKILAKCKGREEETYKNIVKRFSARNSANRPVGEGTMKETVSTPEPTFVAVPPPDTDDYSNEELYGTMQVPIVGIRYYRGVVHQGEWVNLVREPDNPYDPNAIRVDNQNNVQVGHIARAIALGLKPVMDSTHHCTDVRVECSIQQPPRGAYQIQGTAAIYGPPTKAKMVIALLKSRLAGFREGIPPSTLAVNNSVRRLNPVKTQKELNEMFDQYESDFTKEEIPDLAERLAPMSTKLMEHQIQGVSWMLHQEIRKKCCLPPFWEEKIENGKTVYFNSITASSTKTRPEAVRGGILADDMGLGKTIQVIAVIVGNPPHAYQEKRKSSSLGTLIVCPASVLSTWESQIRQHVEAEHLSVCVYHGRGRDLFLLEEFDVVLTTYGTLSTEFVDAAEKKKPTDLGPPQKKRRVVGKMEYLFDRSWHRVVLDEAHFIRNRNTKVHKSVRSLNTIHRWALSGTPIINKAEDLQSLFSFLEINPVNDFVVWKRAIGRLVNDGDELGMARLRVLVKSTCLRRSKSLLAHHLPPRTIELHTLEMDGEQRETYNTLMESARAVFCAVSTGGGENVFRHYSAVLELLLRLRQATCSTKLIKPGRLESAKSCLENMRKAIKGKMLTKEETEDLFKKVQGVMTAGDDEVDHECAVCFEDFVAHEDLLRILRHCGHTFCKNCISQIQNTNQSYHGHRCPLCRKPFDKVDVINPRMLKSLVDKEQMEPRDGADDSTPSMVVEERQIPVKIRALLKELKHVREKGEKALVFSNFTSFLDQIAFFLDSFGFATTRIDGSMSIKKRADSVKTFSTDENIACMLISSKAGGTGLNLIKANHVFLMDLWWNYAAEEQAMDRCYRIGQTKECRVVRYCCKDSVEERILSIQKRKQLLAKSSMNSQAPEERRRARLQDLQSIFC